MRHSMTGFASGQGAGLGLRWSWDIRSVNAKGLDLRLRVPDWIEGLEQALRAELGRRVARGNVSVNLRISAETGEGALALNASQMHSVLDALTEIEAEAMQRGLSLAPSTAAQIVALRGVLDTPQDDTDPAQVRALLLADVAPVLDNFVQNRRDEGAALSQVLTRQLDSIGALVQEAALVAAARQDEQADRLRAALARVLGNAEGVDDARLSQELALIAVKSDVTEEIDRLTAHIAAARSLLQDDGPVGRKLDFLMQEFNREANTLCAKSQSAPLTKLGLDLKTVIDQMREQVQNVE